MPKITDELGMKKTLHEIHSERHLFYWNLQIKEAVRQEFEKALGHVLTQKELEAILLALATGEYALRRRY